MAKRKNVCIVAHTIEEGGRWIPLPKKVLISEEILSNSLSAFPIRSVKMAGLVVHAIRTDKGDEWDIYNGWRIKRRKH